LGDFQGAIRFFKKAIELNLNEPKYLKILGMTYQDLVKTAEADQYFQHAKRLRN